MNIHGFKLLMELGFPVPRKSILFREISEIPQQYYRYERKNWALVGFDDRGSVYNNPYENRHLYRKNGFPLSSLSKEFAMANRRINEQDVPLEHRIFLLCIGFRDKEVLFSGHALKDTKAVYIDVREGDRPSGRDWDPDYSLGMRILGGRLFLGEAKDSPYPMEVMRIGRDAMRIPKNCCADFTCLKDHYLFYHDLMFV